MTYLFSDSCQGWVPIWYVVQRSKTISWCCFSILWRNVRREVGGPLECLPLSCHYSECRDSAQRCSILPRHGQGSVPGCVSTWLCQLVSRCWVSDLCMHLGHMVHKQVTGSWLVWLPHPHRPEPGFPPCLLLGKWEALLWQQVICFLTQTVRFRKGDSAVVSQWKEKIISDKRENNISRNSLCLFSSQNISFRGELSSSYSWSSLKLRTHSLPAFSLNFSANVKPKGRVPREQLLQILISKEIKVCSKTYL